MRSKLALAIRRFFHDRGFLEVETPARIPAPAIETHIDAEPSGDRWLRTSPELHMKRLLCAGCERIFQMGPCFRKGESGRLHRPEFTMLEWYRRGADYLDMLVDVKTLLSFSVKETLGSARLRYQGREIEMFPVWDCMAVEEAFVRFAGWNPVSNPDPDRFDLDLVEKVEPGLADLGRPVILKDYPAHAAGFARLKAGAPGVAERWELYIAGLELANAASELTDAAELRRRFEECARSRRGMGKEVYRTDEEFLAAAGAGLPPCAGVALGVDRLAMLLCDAARIDDVMAF